MEIKYLETVLIAAKYLNFSRAAEENYCSQASVSRQVGIVESDLGIEIFNRSTGNKSVELTEVGKLILPRLEDLVESYNSLLNVTRSTSGLKKMEFRLGLASGPFCMMTKSKVAYELYRKNPDIMLKIDDLDNDTCYEMLRRNKQDAIVIIQAFMDGEDAEQELSGNSEFSFVKLKKQFLQIAFPVDHPLAERESVSYDELKDETFILKYDMKHFGVYKEDPLIKGFLENCKRSGFTPRLTTLGASIVDLRDAAAKAHGWLYPTFQTSSLRNRDYVTIVPVKDSISFAHYYLVSLNDRKKAATEEVGECLKELLN